MAKEVLESPALEPLLNASGLEFKITDPRNYFEGSDPRETIFKYLSGLWTRNGYSPATLGGNQKAGILPSVNADRPMAMSYSYRGLQKKDMAERHEILSQYAPTRRELDELPESDKEGRKQKKKELEELLRKAPDQNGLFAVIDFRIVLGEKGEVMREEAVRSTRRGLLLSQMLPLYVEVPDPEIPYRQLHINEAEFYGLPRTIKVGGTTVDTYRAIPEVRTHLFLDGIRRLPDEAHESHGLGTPWQDMLPTYAANVRAQDT